MMRMHKRHIYLPIILSFFVLSFFYFTNAEARADDQGNPRQHNFGIMAYGGVLTDGNWKEALNPWTGSTLDSQVVGVAGSWTWKRAWHARLSFEIEGAVIKHFGLQEHVELTAVPLAVRWHWFPWTDYVDTTLGLGGGMSYATRPPQAEKVVRGDAEQLLFHWYLEATAAPPTVPVEGVLRLHHRSGGFGLLGTQGQTGSDFITVGVRYRF